MGWDPAVTPLRCLIVDDNVSFLEASSSLLEREGITVVGTASTVADGVSRAEELGPDVVLIDIDLGEESGFSAARQLGRLKSGVSPSLILISAHPEDDFAELVVQSPAVGFISKTRLSAAAIRELLDGASDR